MIITFLGVAVLAGFIDRMIPVLYRRREESQGRDPFANTPPRGKWLLYAGGICFILFILLIALSLALPVISIITPIVFYTALVLPLLGLYRMREAKGQVKY